MPQINSEENINRFSLIYSDVERMRYTIENNKIVSLIKYPGTEFSVQYDYVYNSCDQLSEIREVSSGIAVKRLKYNNDGTLKEYKSSTYTLKFEYLEDNKVILIKRV